MSAQLSPAYPSTSACLHTWRVTFILCGQERFLGYWTAANAEAAKERCRQELKGSEHFQLFARRSQP